MDLRHCLLSSIGGKGGRLDCIVDRLILGSCKLGNGMKTAVVTETEINEVADALRELCNEISNAVGDHDPDDVNDHKNLETAVEISALHAGDILSDIETIQMRFVSDGERAIDPSAGREFPADRRELVGSSRNALLAALHSLNGVRGHDSTSPLDGNKAEIPISQSELATIRAVIKGAIELHGAELGSKLIQRALAELLELLREIYERLRTLMALAVAGSILFTLVKLLEKAVSALDTLLKNAQSIVV